MSRLARELVRDEALAHGNTGSFTVNSTPHALPVYARFGFKPTGPRVETIGNAFVPLRYCTPSH